VLWTTVTLVVQPSLQESLQNAYKCITNQELAILVIRYSHAHLLTALLDITCLPFYTHQMVDKFCGVVYSVYRVHFASS